MCRSPGLVSRSPLAELERSGAELARYLNVPLEGV